MTTSLGARETITLVARREIRTQLRSRSFVYGLLIIIAIFAMYGLIFAFIGSQGSSATLGVTPQARPAVAAVQEAARADDFDLTTVDVTPAAGTEQVRSGDLDALLAGGPGSYELVGRDSIDSDVSRLVTQTVRAQALDQALRAAGTDPAALAQASTVRSQTLEPEDPLQGQRLGIAIAVAVLLFFSLSNYGGAVAQGVVEEKSSRVVELLLSTIKPLHLLAGKIIGLGLVGLLQLLILGAIATTGALAFGVISVPTTVIAALGQAVLWYLLGFFLFATLYASAGALVSRQEELQSAITPIAFLVMIPFVVTVSVLPNDPRNPLVAVLSFIPFFAPTTMPARVALGVAPWWQVLVAALLTLAAIVGMVWLSARIYQNSVLRTGAKVSWREGLTGARS